MEEVRVNVRRAEGAARASRTSRSSTLLRVGSPPLGPPRVYLTTIPHIYSPSPSPSLLTPPSSLPALSRFPPSSLGLGDLQEQAGVASRRGWRRRRWSGGEGGGWSRKRRTEEEDLERRGRGEELGLSLDQYSHLLPAGPGRTLRSEAHLLADIKPPFLRGVLHPLRPPSHPLPLPG